MQLLMGLLQLRRVEMVGGQRAVGMRHETIDLAMIFDGK